MKVAVVGASGFVGGELLRLLLAHGGFALGQATSQRHDGEPVETVHPNLRGSGLRFTAIESLEPCDLIFSALSHGASFDYIDRLRALAPRVIDLSADFRILDPQDYARAYRQPHPRPDLLGRFVRGLPELDRHALRDAVLVAVPGCMATAAILALVPLYAAGLVEPDVIVDAKMGSSGSGGRDPRPGNSHSERDGVMRSFKPVGHRHLEEIAQALRDHAARVSLSATAVGSVRGVLVTAHAFLRAPGATGIADVWQAYRGSYGNEPFVRLVARRSGLHQYPEPSVLAGANFCDIGFALDQDKRRLVVLAALDNLVKGSAGNALQCANLMAGYPEQQGLGFAGLHPV